MSGEELIDCLLKSEKLKRKYGGSMSGRLLDEKYWTDILIPGLWDVYMKNRGSRSKKKTEYFHGFLQKYLEENIFSKWEGYEVFMERPIESYNLTGKKNSDIVVYKNGSIFLIIPIKMIMSNYKQNKYNYFENLSGELMHLVLKSQ